MNTSRLAWYNENEGRAYPLSESASCADDTGVKIENDIIADLGIVVPRVYSGLRIGSLYVTPQLISVVISGPSGTPYAPAGGVLIGSFARSAMEPYKAYPLVPLVDGASGWIVFGNNKCTTAKRHVFSTPEQGALEPRSIRVIPAPGVTSIIREGNGEAIDGIVKLEGSSALDITIDPDNASNILIRLKPEARSQFTEACMAEGSKATCGTPIIRRINNVPADANGVITLRFD